jgi:hypothetical protein
MKESLQEEIERLKKAGNNKVIAPNDLPICTIRGYDGALLEHEHADHPTYLFPVMAEDYNGDKEEHALIWTDGTRALTLYEYCYTFFIVANGLPEYSKHSKDYMLTLFSIDKIKRFAREQEQRKSP